MLLAKRQHSNLRSRTGSFLCSRFLLYATLPTTLHDVSYSICIHANICLQGKIVNIHIKSKGTLQSCTVLGETGNTVIVQISAYISKSENVKNVIIVILTFYTYCLNSRPIKILLLLKMSGRRVPR
jgi:hypothetical protein